MRTCVPGTNADIVVNTTLDRQNCAHFVGQYQRRIQKMIALVAICRLARNLTNGHPFVCWLQEGVSAVRQRGRP